MNSPLVIISRHLQHKKDKTMTIRLWLTCLLLGWLTFGAVEAKGQAVGGTVANYQKQLDAYYKRIRSVHLKYDQTVSRDQSSNFLRELEAFAAKERADGLEQQRRMNGLRTEPSIPLEHDGRATIHYELAEQFPSIALTKHAHLSKDGVDATEFVSKFLCKNTYYELSSHSKSVTQSLKVNMNMFGDSPINAIGKRIIHSVNQPLSDLLLSHDATIIEGGDPSDEVVVVKAGPNFSDAIRPSKLRIGAFVLVYLKKSSPVYPLKIVFNQENLRQSDKGSDWVKEPLVQEYEMSDYRDVADGTGGAKIPFPFHFRSRGLGETTEWQITSAAINPVLPLSTFVPKTPEGYSVSVDGKANVTVIEGGPTVKDRVAKETAAMAKRLLAQAIPASKNQQTSFMLVGALTTCVVIVGLVVIYRRR